MSSEVTIQGLVQTAMQGLSSFANTSVTINDFSVWDDSFVGSPYLIIQTAETVSMDYDMGCPEIVTRVKMELCVLWDADGGWKATLDSVRDARQEIFDYFSTPANRTLASGVVVESVATGGVIRERYDPGVSWEQIHTILPGMLTQIINVTVRDMTG